MSIYFLLLGVNGFTTRDFCEVCVCRYTHNETGPMICDIGLPSVSNINQATKSGNFSLVVGSNILRYLSYKTKIDKLFFAVIVDSTHSIPELKHMLETGMYNINQHTTANKNTNPANLDNDHSNLLDHSSNIFTFFISTMNTRSYNSFSEESLDDISTTHSMLDISTKQSNHPSKTKQNVLKQITTQSMDRSLKLDSVTTNKVILTSETTKSVFKYGSTTQAISLDFYPTSNHKLKNTIGTEKSLFEFEYGAKQSSTQTSTSDYVKTKSTMQPTHKSLDVHNESSLYGVNLTTLTVKSSLKFVYENVSSINNISNVMSHDSNVNILETRNALIGSCVTFFVLMIMVVIVAAIYIQKKNNQMQTMQNVFIPLQGDPNRETRVTVL